MPPAKSNRSGSGPAGISGGSRGLQRAGHHVTIFEAFHKLGGVLRYGIPEFRLPNEIIDKEIETLAAMGVEIKQILWWAAHAKTHRPG